MVDGRPAGFISIAPRRQLTNPADQRFAREQARSIYLIAAAALLFAAAIAAVLARQLTHPVRILANSTRAIAAGRLDTRVVATNNDELGDLAHDFNRLAATLEANRNSRQRWVADIAHELRTPLAVLKGELDAIEDGVRVFNATTRASLQAEVARLTQLVGDLHELSVHDDGALNYKPERIDVSALVTTTLSNAEQRLKDAGITLTLNVVEQIEAMADATRIEQLLANLVENTIRYTDAPGSLVVTCKQDANSIEISFADSAPSVPEDTLDHLFERLYRVDTSRNRNSGGSGLGLSICKAIVDAHSGTISAAPSDSGGLFIQIRLPLQNKTGEAR